MGMFNIGIDIVQSVLPSGGNFHTLGKYGEHRMLTCIVEITCNNEDTVGVAKQLIVDDSEQKAEGHANISICSCPESVACLLAQLQHRELVIEATSPWWK